MQAVFVVPGNNNPSFAISGEPQNTRRFPWCFSLGGGPGERKAGRMGSCGSVRRRFVLSPSCLAPFFGASVCFSLSRNVSEIPHAGLGVAREKGRGEGTVVCV